MIISKNINVFAIILFLFIGTNGLFAQKKKPQNDPGYEYKAVHFGFTIGLNFMDFGFNRRAFNDPINGKDYLYADVASLAPGFHVQAISDFRLGEYLSLRAMPGVSFGSRQLTYFNESNQVNNETDQWEIESTYIEMPVLLKYKSKRLNNYMPYLITGANFRFDMAAQIGLNQEGDNQPYIDIRPFDIAYEIGFGVDCFLPYFKFGTEFKLSLGLRDLLLPNPYYFVNEEGVDPEVRTKPYTESISKLTSNLFMISFHFE